jgi:hypothetical protein
MTLRIDWNANNKEAKSIKDLFGISPGDNQTLIFQGYRRIPSESSESGSRAFEDEFNGTDLNTSLWTPTLVGTATVGGGEIAFADDTVTIKAVRYSRIDIEGKITIKCRFKYNSDTNRCNIKLGMCVADESPYIYFQKPDNSTAFTGQSSSSGSESAGYNLSKDAYHVLTIVIQAGTYSFDVDGTTSTTCTVIPEMDSLLFSFIKLTNVAAGTHTLNVDYWRVTHSQET